MKQLPPLIAAAVLLAACGGGGSSKDTPARLGAEDACNQLLEVMATRYDQCLGMTRDGVFQGETTACARVGAEEALGRLSTDPAGFATCLSETAAYSCTALQDFYDAPPSCYAAFRGTVPDGGACRVVGGMGECATGTCFPVQGCGQEGVCIPYRPVDQPCGGDMEICAPGLECGGSELCENISVAGVDQPCGGAVTCRPELYCDHEAGACKPRVALDGTCDYAGDNRREDNPCAEGGACTSRGTCVRSKHLGEDCTPGDVECDFGTWCDGGSPTATTGTCTAWPTVGGECGVLENDEVRECVGAWCDDGPPRTCRAYLALTTPCDEDAWDSDKMCGPDAACIDGTCQRAYCNW